MQIDFENLQYQHQLYKTEIDQVIQDENTYNLDQNKTRAIIPISLCVQPLDIDSVKTIADKHNLKFIIDGVQSFGSIYKSKRDSSLGNISTTSFPPTKQLGCFGDGGAQYSIRVKNRDELQEKLKGQGISAAVYYPVLLHLQECFEYLGFQKGELSIAERARKL